MWSPTHVQVTVQRAKGLLTKGKNNTNNCFVTIALGKEKYQTSIREKASQNVEWHEECELAIPDKGNTAELILTCLHHNNLGIDEFLGQISLPLRDMDAYDRPRSKWFKLNSKPGQEKKDKERGELEIRINFTVKAGSLSDLSKKEKHKSSFNTLASSVGGSLLSIGTLEKKKGLKKFANSIGSKLHLTGKKKDKKDGGGDNDSFNGSVISIGTPNSSLGGSRKWNGKNYLGNTDPGVAEDGDLKFDNISQRSSASGSSISHYIQEQSNVLIRQSSSSLKSEDPNNRISHPEIKVTMTSYEPFSNDNSSANYLDVNKTGSIKRQSYDKQRLPLPIPESNREDDDFKIPTDDDENDDVILRDKGQPILNENIYSTIQMAPPKPKPRKFEHVDKNVGDDDFNFDNLSCNSSPYSSMTSNSHYDYNTNNDSRRSSKAYNTDEIEAIDSNLYASFSRADSKRRASRKKYFTPIATKEQDVENDGLTEHDIKREQHLQIESKIVNEIDGKQNIKNNYDFNISPIQKMPPKYEKSSEEYYAVECQVVKPLEVTKLENVANKSNKIQIFETREVENVEFEKKFVEIENPKTVYTVEIKEHKSKPLVFENRIEENVKSNANRVEIREADPLKRAEVTELETSYNSICDQKLNDSFETTNKVSTLTFKLGARDNKYNMEVVGANDNKETTELRKSNSDLKFEIHSSKNDSLSADESSYNRLSVSSIRSRFEENSPQSSISSRTSIRRSIEKSEFLSTDQLKKRASITTEQNTIADQQVKTEFTRRELFPIERFEQANVQKSAVEFIKVKQTEKIKEQNFATECDFATVLHSSENVAVETQVAKTQEIKQEEHIATNCFIPEVYQNAVPQSQTNITESVRIFDTLKEEHVAVQCNSTEKYENAVLEHIAEESDIPQILGTREEVSIAKHHSISGISQNAIAQHIRVESFIPQTLEQINEEYICMNTEKAEAYVQANTEHIASQQSVLENVKIPAQIEERKEYHLAYELTNANIIQNSNIENIAKEYQIGQILETSKEEYIASDCNIRELSKKAYIENIIEDKYIVKTLENQTIENFANEINFIDAVQQKNLQNIAISSNTVQIVESTENLVTNIPPPETKPLSPDNLNVDNLKKSSSNILQMIEIVPLKNECPDFDSISSDYEQKRGETKTESIRPTPKPRKIEQLFNYEESSSSNSSSLEFYTSSGMQNTFGNQDPGVIEDDDEFTFDKISYKSSGSSLNIRGNNDYNQQRVPSPVVTKEEDIYRVNTKPMIPPPAKPPRNPSDQKLDEWESKLYGNHLEIGSSDSLKRRSWGNNRIPLNTTEENEEDYEDVKLTSSNGNINNSEKLSSDSSSEISKSPLSGKLIQPRSDKVIENVNFIKNEVVHSESNAAMQSSPIVKKPVETRLSPTMETLKADKKDTKFFDKSPPIMRAQSREKIDNEDQKNNRNSLTGRTKPKILPRSDTISEFNDDIIQSPDDTKEIREKLKKDQKEINEKTEKKHRFGKFKYFNKKSENRADSIDELHGERHNPIGHENFNDNQNSLPELSQELLNKYEGKSREDIILIADSFEKDMISERNRVKELEDYLDNLLLRVMETHPKILQYPFRTTSTKSG